MTDGRDVLLSAPHTVLLVEDEVIIRMMLKTQLLRLGVATVHEAATGEAAVSLASRTPPDLVCMDIRLRGPMDGIEAARLISASRSVPFIFISAYDSHELLRELSGVRVAGIVDKPVSLDELSQLVRRSAASA